MAGQDYMESLMFNNLVQWIVYLLAAAGCYWGWNKMFFWLKQKDALIISRLFGAVIFFTPAPLSGAGDGYAPAFIVVLFRAFLERNADVLEPVIWLLAALVGGFLIVSAWALIQFLRQKFFPTSEAD